MQRMRTLYLLRHAKSSWDDPALDDHERPLAPRGEQATPLIADHMRATGITPDVVLCSSATRARQTLDLLGDALPADCDVRIEDEVYVASADTLLARLQGLQRTAERMMLVGHNPALQQLALQLSSGGLQLDQVRQKFPTAALATLEATIDDWSQLASQSAQLTAFVRPKDLEPDG